MQIVRCATLPHESVFVTNDWVLFIVRYLTWHSSLVKNGSSMSGIHLSENCCSIRELYSVRSLSGFDPSVYSCKMVLNFFYLCIMGIVNSTFYFSFLSTVINMLSGTCIQSPVVIQRTVSAFICLKFLEDNSSWECIVMHLPLCKWHWVSDFFWYIVGLLLYKIVKTYVMVVQR